MSVVDLSLVERHAWLSHAVQNNVYAVRNATVLERALGAPKRIRMHNVINPPPEGYMSDHRDGNGLNNTRGNLRHATHQQNMYNRRTHKESGLPKGVIALGKRYMAKIRANGVNMVVGVYDTVEEASAAYDRAALEHHGEFARLNSAS